MRPDLADVAATRASSARAARASTPTPPDAGCCTLGAHFADKDDEKRVAGVRRAARRRRCGSSSPDAGKVRRKDWIETDDEGERKTRSSRSTASGVHLPQPRRLPRPAPAAPCTRWRCSRAATRSRPSRTCAGSCRSGVRSATSSARTARRTPRSRSASTTAAAGARAATTSTGTAPATPRRTSRREPVYVTNAPELIELMGQAGVRRAGRGTARRTCARARRSRCTPPTRTD